VRDIFYLVCFHFLSFKKLDAMKAVTLVVLSLITTVSFAQKKTIQDIAGEISTERLKNNLYYLASEKMEGRAMGSHGDTLASEYIAASFKESRLTGPYNNDYYQAINVLRKWPVAAELSIGSKKFASNTGWSFPLRGTENTQLSNLPVVFAGYGIENSAYNDFDGIDVKGKAVLLLSGQPRDNSGIYLLSGSNRPAVISPVAAANTLKEKGAAVVLIYNSRFTGDNRQAAQPVYRSPYTAAPAPSLPTLTISEVLANELLAPAQKTIRTLEQEITEGKKPQSVVVSNTVGLSIQVTEQVEHAPNVIGYIKGTDPAAGHIILSAHHDHVGRQNGRDIWYGAVDNASGTVALMEIATLMNEAAKNGLKPKRTIVFASYTGEERGLLGSHHLAANPLFPLNQNWGVLNIDMMGRVDTFYSGRRADSSYAYILVKDSLNHGLRNALLDANQVLGKLKLDTHYEQPQFSQRRITGSDQYPFYAKGVPFIRIDCGFSKDYHQSTDTPDKINYELLTNQAQLAFLTAWNMANN
jgi:hypothetical protein